MAAERLHGHHPKKRALALWRWIEHPEGAPVPHEVLVARVCQTFGCLPSEAEREIREHGAACVAVMETQALMAAMAEVKDRGMAEASAWARRVVKPVFDDLLARSRYGGVTDGG